jgi:hypothetical protein
MGPTTLPVIWAQATGSNSLDKLALRRWSSSLTLSAPDPLPGLTGLWALLLGLTAVLAVALLAQGPGRALGQFFDLPGHVRLIAAAWDRLRRSARVVAVTVGVTVLAWTASQTMSFSRPQGKDDLMLLTKSRSLAELAFDQGVLAALTPLRDVLGLGDVLPLLAVATVVVFRFATDPLMNAFRSPAEVSHRPRPFFGPTLIWVGTSLYLLYRLVAVQMGTGDLPLLGYLGAEALVVPVLMALADGVLLAWILAELRGASLGQWDEGVFDVRPTLGLMPGASLACLAAIPARYMAASAFLVAQQLPASTSGSALRAFLRWQCLGWGLADLQAAALTTAGLIGAVAWSQGTWGDALRGYLRLLRAEGGRLAALLTLAGAAAGSLAALAYPLILALPAQPWVLAAADSYAHYATLPVGLLLLAALVELGERSLPVAARAAPD